MKIRKRFEICLSLAWIAKSKPKNREIALELAGFGNTAKQKGISKTLSSAIRGDQRKFADSS